MPKNKSITSDVQPTKRCCVTVKPIDLKELATAEESLAVLKKLLKKEDSA